VNASTVDMRAVQNISSADRHGGDDGDEDTSTHQTAMMCQHTVSWPISS